MSLIQYPFVQGVRMDPSSVELRLGSPVNLILLFVSLSWKRARTRTKVVLNHPDPVGKTRGKNEYTAALELAIEEYNVVLSTLGQGYGDKQFTMFVNIVELGFLPVRVQIRGCSLDEDDGDVSGSNGLTRKIALNPTKILINDQDDLNIALPGAIPALAGGFVPSL